MVEFLEVTLCDCKAIKRAAMTYMTALFFADSNIGI